MNRPHRNLAMLLLLTVASDGAFALSSDRRQPIYINADRVVIDEQRGMSTYRGEVELTQGTMRVQADSLTVQKKGEELQSVVAEGRPTHFQQRPDNADQDIRGQADHIEYRAKAGTVLLRGNAHIWQGKDEFSGERILYDVDRSVVRANGDPGKGGRVRAIIHPEGQEKK